jgi:hypothetical protein
MPDWLDALIKIITFVLAFYGVMSAVAAKRSAYAAEDQATAARAQADAAIAQLLEARKQSSRGAKDLAQDFAEAIDREISAVIGLTDGRHHLALALYDFEMHTEDNEMAEHLLPEAQAYFESQRRHGETVRQNDRRQIGEATFSDLRKQFSAASAHCSQAVSGYIDDLRIMGASKQRNAVRADAAARKAALARAAMEKADEQSISFMMALEQLSRQKWSDVRRFEQEAQGIEAPQRAMSPEAR